MPALPIGVKPGRSSAAAAMLMLLSTSARAQVNIENLRPDTDLSGVSAAVGLDLAVRTGNVDIVQFTLNGRLDLVTGIGNSLVIANGDLGFQDGERFSNAGLVHLRQGYTLPGRIHPEAFTQVNYNKPQALDFRWLVGAGVRLNLVQSGRAAVWLGSGYMFEHERLGLTEDAVHPTRTAVSRWSSYLSSRLAFERDVVLTATAYLQPQLDDFEDVRNLTEIDLAVPISTRVSLVVSYDMRYDSRPPDDVASLDTTFRSGVRAAF